MLWPCSSKNEPPDFQAVNIQKGFSNRPPTRLSASAVRVSPGQALMEGFGAARPRHIPQLARDHHKPSTWAGPSKSWARPGELACIKLEAWVVEREGAPNPTLGRHETPQELQGTRPRGTFRSASTSFQLVRPVKWAFSIHRDRGAQASFGEVTM